jgi:UDP-N-acetylglucosamine acyltransferase
MGDNNVLQNSVTINYGARIGNGKRSFPVCQHRTKPQD